MPRFERNRDDGKEPPRLGQEIVVPQCKICTHPQRKAIDRVIATGTMSDAELARTFGDEFSRAAVQRHRTGHLNYYEAGIRRVVDKKIADYQENAEAAIGGVVAREVYMELVLKRGIEAVANGEVIPEVRDVLGIIAQQETSAATREGIELERYKVQFMAFLQAIQEIAGQEMGRQIWARTQEILGASGDDPAPLPPGQ